jgi:hypothetical protein
MKINTDIVEKIRKLLALANCDAAQPGEVENAMAKAKELAMRHAIDISSINLDADKGSAAFDIEQDSSLKPCSKYKQPFHTYVFHILKKVLGVHVILGGGYVSNRYNINHIHLVGDPTDITIAKAVFPWLEVVFPKTFKRLVREGTLRDCPADANGCYFGLMTGIIEANKRQEEALPQEDRSKWALIVVGKEDAIEKKTAEMFPKMKQARKAPRQHNHLASALGYQEGKKLNLNQVGK